MINPREMTESELLAVPGVQRGPWGPSIGDWRVHGYLQTFQLTSPYPENDGHWSGDLGLLEHMLFEMHPHLETVCFGTPHTAIRRILPKPGFKKLGIIRPYKRPVSLLVGRDWEVSLDWPTHLHLWTNYSPDLPQTTIQLLDAKNLDKSLILSFFALYSRWEGKP